jgi:hypothetical protein
MLTETPYVNELLLMVPIVVMLLRVKHFNSVWSLTLGCSNA